MEANKQFAHKFDLPFLLLCDTERNIGEKYGAATDANTPHAERISYLIDPAGKIAKVYADVDPETHAAHVLADLQRITS